MSPTTNHFKLGLFVLIGLAAVLVTAIGLGAYEARKETVTYHVFFNESVQGLDVGAPVKFRGVTIGTVSAIEIAPDHRHVDVSAELKVEEIKRMGLTEAGDDLRFEIPHDLRAQLGSQGITGVKFVLIDFFAIDETLSTELPFETPANTIPAIPSLMKSVEDSIVKAMDSIPRVSEKILAIATKVDVLIEELQRQGIPATAAALIERITLSATKLNILFDRFGSDDGLLTSANLASAKLNMLLDRLGSDDGLLTSSNRAATALGDFGKTADGTARELENTLREVAAAAEAFRELAEALERDPDMLLKGRSKGRER